MTDPIEHIRQREIEHQRDHDRNHTESCLPAGCSPDEGDIPVLLREVDRLSERLENFHALRRARNAINLGDGTVDFRNQFSPDGLVTLPINAQGHVDCPKCATGVPIDLASHPSRISATERVAVDGVTETCPECGIVPGGLVAHVGPHSWASAGSQAEWTEAQIRALATEEGIDLTDCIIGGSYASNGINRAQMVERLRMLVAIPKDDGATKRARPNAGRPRHCPNFKTCHGKLKAPADKEAGLCNKCRKAAKSTS